MAGGCQPWVKWLNTLIRWLRGLYFEPVQHLGFLFGLAEILLTGFRIIDLNTPYISKICVQIIQEKHAKGIHVLLKSKLEWSGDPEHFRNRWIDCVSQQVHHYASGDPKVTWAMVSHFELYLFESLKPQGEPIKVHLGLDHNKWLWF